MSIVYKQVLPDACLPSCLMMYLNQLKKLKSPSLKLESEILIEGGKLGRLNRTFGHLLFVSKKFNLKAKYITNSKLIYDEAYKILASSNYNKINIENLKIDLNLIKKLAAEGPLIISVDNYTFNHDFHFPHFVYLENIKKDVVQLIEPWQGKRMTITTEGLMRGVRTLEEEVLYWPELIQIN